MGYFLKDSPQNNYISWDRLINDINQTKIYNSYCKSNNYYEVFKHIILSMIFGKEVILLDADFTDTELVNLTGHSNYDHFDEAIIRDNSNPLIDKSTLIGKLRNVKNDWKVTIFSSGTTGIPKKVTHDFNSITRFVKYSEKNNNSIWGFAYNPTHMAGIQVFLQALLNGNSIVRLFGLTPNEIFQSINENAVTHISATPTFYKLLLPCKNSFSSILKITSGGEKFNERTIKQLEIVFPNAKITNVYASTEAGTLFASENDIFTIKSEFEHLIKVDNDELLIHKSLMGQTEIQLDEWYKTGDLINIITDAPLKFSFISRKSDMINVGGYKVNPIEVEETIVGLAGIKDARVYAKPNSVIGNIICCEVVRDNEQITESLIREYLQSKIQEFKIPRIIKFVTELSTTRTGKIKRN